MVVAASFNLSSQSSSLVVGCGFTVDASVPKDAKSRIRYSPHLLLILAQVDHFRQHIASNETGRYQNMTEGVAQAYGERY